VFDYICFILEQVEDAQAREAPVQRLADSIAGPFVYTVMTLAAATFSFWCALTFIFFYSMKYTRKSCCDKQILLF